MKPSEVIWMDGELVPWDQAQVHVLTHSLHYGNAVFEGMRAYATPDGPALLRLDEHDGRRWILPTGWDAYSQGEQWEPLDRYAAEHRVSDRLVHAHSTVFRLPNGSRVLPAADNVSRMVLEEELLAIRAMRHVFRVRPNMTIQGWVTLLNPMIYHGYSLHWALVLHGERLLEPTFPSTRAEQQPEFLHSQERHRATWAAQQEQQ